jgi:TRAP-type C4-dicarboxylate transport system permease small subunit
MKTVNKILNTLCRYLGYLGAAILGFMMLYTTFDIIKRAVTGKSMTGTTEVMAYMFCALLYSTYAYTQTRHGHVHVTIITEAIKGKGKFILWACTSWIGAITGVFLTCAAYNQMLKQIEDGTYTLMLHIPYEPVYIFSTFGMAVFAIVLIFDAIKAVLAIFSEEYAKEIAETCFILQK